VAVCAAERALPAAAERENHWPFSKIAIRVCKGLTSVGMEDAEDPVDFEKFKNKRAIQIKGHVVDLQGKRSPSATIHLVSPQRLVTQKDVDNFFWLEEDCPMRYVVGSHDSIFLFETVMPGQHIIYAEGATHRSQPGLMHIQDNKSGPLAVQLTLRVPMAGAPKDDVKVQTVDARNELVSKWAGEIKDIVTSKRNPQSTVGESIEIADRLFLGDARAARDLKALKTKQIDAVLNCSNGTYTRTSAATYHSSTQYLELSDSKIGDETLTAQQLKDSLDFISKNLADNRHVLVHCISGTNRSAAICASHIMLTNQWDLLKVVYHISATAPGYVLSAPKVRTQLAELAIQHDLTGPKKIKEETLPASSEIEAESITRRVDSQPAGSSTPKIPKLHLDQEATHSNNTEEAWDFRDAASVASTGTAPAVPKLNLGLNTLSTVGGGSMPARMDKPMSQTTRPSSSAATNYLATSRASLQTGSMTRREDSGFMTQRGPTSGSLTARGSMTVRAPLTPGAAMVPTPRLTPRTAAAALENIRTGASTPRTSRARLGPSAVVIPRTQSRAYVNRAGMGSLQARTALVSRARSRLK